MPRLKAPYQVDLENLGGEARSIVDRFLASRRRTRAASTVIRNRATVLKWALWCDERGIDPVEARRKDAEAFAETWPWAATTKCQAIGDLSTFYRWLIRQELCQRNPWDDIERPRKPRRIPLVLNDQQLQALPGAVRRPTVRDIRDRAIILTLESTGARIGEVRSMDTARLVLNDPQGAYAVVYSGKTGRERLVYLDPPAAEAIRRWMMVRRQWAKTGTALWVGRHGDRIGYTACHDLLIRAAERSRIGRRVTPHQFRHTFGTAALEAGANLREVQELLGHANISTTQLYTQVAPSRLRDVHRKVRGTYGDQPAAN